MSKPFVLKNIHPDLKIIELNKIEVKLNFLQNSNSVSPRFDSPSKISRAVARQRGWRRSLDV